MHPTKTEFVDHLPEEIETKMRAGFVTYETSHGVDVNYKPFSLILWENDSAIGAICAFTAYSEIYIDDLWVDETHRGKGYGRRLIQELDQHFQDKGFNNINLVTSQFQAPEFYKKCGFQEEFVRVNLQNPQLTKTFMVKYFDEEAQTQGILQGSKGDRKR